jgi:hypothetical protein
MQTAQTFSDHQRYARCIEASKRIRWDIDRDVIHGREFDLRDNIAVSAGSYAKLAMMAGVIIRDQTAVARARGGAKFMQQSGSLQHATHMSHGIEVVGDEHGEPRRRL